MTVQRDVGTEALSATPMPAPHAGIQGIQHADERTEALDSRTESLVSRPENKGLSPKHQHASKPSRQSRTEANDQPSKGVDLKPNEPAYF